MGRIPISASYGRSPNWVAQSHRSRLSLESPESVRRAAARANFYCELQTELLNCETFGQSVPRKGGHVGRSNRRLTCGLGPATLEFPSWDEANPSELRLELRSLAFPQDKS